LLPVLSTHIKIVFMNKGFIGLGSLGTPIALNLLEGTGQLAVYNRTVAKTASLSAKGAVVCDSIAALAKSCSVVFSIVSDDAALESICKGKDGLLEHLVPGSIHVSMSTVLPQTAAALAALHKEKQLHYLAAPVFGRPEAAAAKKLNYVVSGEATIRQQVTPLLKTAGATGVWDFGDVITAANTVKLCGNFLIASALEAIGESVALANQSGINAADMWSMFSQTLFNTPLYQNYSNIILQQQFEPAAFTVKLGLKDMNLVVQQADHVQQPMPLAQLLRKHMQQLVQEDKAQLDWSAVSLAAK
jgi:3-hydroxyisobutyrate dehydrogenase-like beta-hydroxyacid dehydrogenase